MHILFSYEINVSFINKFAFLYDKMCFIKNLLLLLIIQVDC